MRAEAGRVSGVDGCNSFVATMTGDAAQGVISGFSTTLRACEDRRLQAQANRVAAILTAAPRYEARDRVLTVSNGVGELRFRRVGARQG